MPSTPPPPSIDDRQVPGPLGATSVADGRSALVRIVVALAVAAGLSTERLVITTEQMAYGTTRTVLLSATELAHGVASSVGLDQAGVAVDHLTGRTPVQEPAATAGVVPFAVRPTDEPEPTAPTPSLMYFALTTATMYPHRPGIDHLQPPVAAAADTSTTTTTTTTTAVDQQQGRPVDEADKLRLWAGGDSLGEYVGNHLLFPMADSELTDVELSYHISTGLARPDYFDWLAEIRDVMERVEPPEALVFMVGGNDDQNMLQDSEVLDLGSEAWLAEYRRRVVAFMDNSDLGSSHLYWIGLPPMREQAREIVSLEINQILTGEAESRPWVTYVDIQPLFTGPDGGFSTHIADADGRQRVVRAGDGVHITFVGSEWVAERVWAAIENRWQLGPGGDSDPGIAPEGLTEPVGLRPGPQVLPVR